MKFLRKYISQYIPQFVIGAFLILIMTLANSANLSVPRLLSDSLIRLGMNGVLTLSMIPMLYAGAGLNFGLAFGITAGLLGMSLAVNFRFAGLSGFSASILIAIIPAILLGLIYAYLLNRVKGREETAGIFAGFSLIFLMNFFWATAPFTNPAMLWPIGGQGMRPTINLTPYFGKALTNLWPVQVGEICLPLGLLAAFFAFCLLIHLFFQTRIGLAIAAIGENEHFARLAGVNIERMRTIAIVLSTALAAAGICFYAQGYGFIELYDAPLMMAFPAASAILLGGYIGKTVSVWQAIVGTFLFQSLYVFTGPLANLMLAPEVSEILRMLIANGVILYSLFYAGRRRTYVQR